jgi:anti-sigma factor RsiW
MKMVNKTDNTCTLGGEMLAYLYDELSSEGRERFETHLEGCGQCIDEFAELSEARYSVYEWKNVEFAPLATPRFEVPLEEARAGVSWLDPIRALFGFNGRAAVAGGLAVLILGVLGFAGFLSSPETPAVANLDRSRPSAAAPTVVFPHASDVETAEVRKPEVLTADKATVPARGVEQTTVEVRKQGETARVKPVRPSRVETVQTRRTPTNRRLDNSPTLGQYVEDRDESLRLSDLFDDLDSRELD